MRCKQGDLVLVLRCPCGRCAGMMGEAIQRIETYEQTARGIWQPLQAWAVDFPGRQKRGLYPDADLQPIRPEPDPLEKTRDAPRTLDDILRQQIIGGFL